MLGTVALLLGVLFYILGRPPEHTYFLGKLGVEDTLYSFVRTDSIPFGHNLPSFIHVFAFILLTAALLPRSKKRFLFISIAWLVIDIVFEMGQKFKVFSTAVIPQWFSGISCLENSKSYFLMGAFDYCDLVATGLGTISAYVVLMCTTKNDSRCKPGSIYN